MSTSAVTAVTIWSISVVFKSSGPGAGHGRTRTCQQHLLTGGIRRHGLPHCTTHLMTTVAVLASAARKRQAYAPDVNTVADEQGRQQTLRSLHGHQQQAQRKRALGTPRQAA